jgi:autoinducer 2-degrading protein
VCLRIKPHRRAEFLECIKANQLGTLATERNAITYVYGEDESETNTFRFFEQYVGRDGFVEHAMSSHFANWDIFANSDPFTAEPEVKFFVEDGPNTSCPGATDVRDAINEAFAADDDDGAVRLFCLDVRMHVRPDMREQFLDAIRLDQEGAVTSETRAVSYVFGEDVDSPNVFHMFEAYAGGRGGFEEHTRTSHYRKWAKFKEEKMPFAGPTEVGYYEIRLPYGGPSR